MLDEMATICPLPNLPSYLADGGGRGIQVIYMVQAPAQLRRRYGAAGAAAIRGATNVLLVGGGIDDPRDLEDWSKLVGEVSVSSRLRTWGRGGAGVVVGVGVGCQAPGAGAGGDLPALSWTGPPIRQGHSGGARRPALLVGGG
ncbi:MAG: TraM recognition domain-containing protein [Acidimicrobiales bacterium]